VSYEVILRNVKAVENRIAAQEARLRRNKDAAAVAAAKVLVPFVKAALPRDSKSSRPGYLRSHVKVYQDIHGEGVAKVKLVGTLAHLVYGDTAAHEIRPAGSEAVAGFNARALVMKGSRGTALRMKGAASAKHAISFGGNAYARALHPAHHGASDPLPHIRIEHAGEARLAAAEVLSHGR
jgi:hypothetical protein